MVLDNPFTAAFLFSIAIQAIFFVFAASFKTDKVTDLSYGLTFVVIAIYLLFTKSVFTYLQIILATMILIWGSRLAFYLFSRILKTKKDDRFDGIRENFFAFGKFWLLQGISVWIIMLPAIVVFSIPQNVSLIQYIGFTIWIIGFSIEVISDAQKNSFRNNPENKGKFISSGLWKYSRHPNYFGEAMLWWGIFIISIPLLKNWLWLTATGPIYITMLLLFVTGIPPLGKKADIRYGNLKEYKEYKKKTSVFLILPNKK